MKKVSLSSLLVIASLMITQNSMAQNIIDIGEEINKQGNSFIKGFAVISLVGLICVFIWRINDFTDKNGDSKKAWGYIIAYIITVGIVIGVAAVLRGINI